MSTSLSHAEYVRHIKFKRILNLGVFDARHTTGWYIDNSELFDKLILVDSYDFKGSKIQEDPKELIQTIRNRISNKPNIDLHVMDANDLNYTGLDIDLAILDCHCEKAMEKAILKNPSIVFCYSDFFNAIPQTGHVFKMINSGLIFPFLYVQNPNEIFFTADKNLHEKYFQEASSVNFTAPYNKYEKYFGSWIVIPRDQPPFYKHQTTVPTLST